MSKIIAIHSFRGGAGKSHTTANLAAVIAQGGKKVGILDPDTQTPGIHILFNLDEERMDRALNDYLWGNCSIEHASYDVSPLLEVGAGQMAIMGGGIHLVPSSAKPADIARVLREGYDVNLLNESLHDLGRRLALDYLLVDTRPGLGEDTLLAIALSDVLVIMLRHDRQDFYGTGIAVDVARKLDVPNLYLVVNEVLPRYDFEAVRRQVEASYGVAVAGVLPLSEDLAGLASASVFALRFPDHPLTDRFREIAQRITA